MRWPTYLIMASYSREAAKFLLSVIFDNRRKHFSTIPGTLLRTDDFLHSVQQILAVTPGQGPTGRCFQLRDGSGLGIDKIPGSGTNQSGIIGH